MAGTGERILTLWRALEQWPGGERLFAVVLGRIVPYSGTISPRVRHLEPGSCRVEMRDRRRVRNHLRSVHAVALVNLGELATGLATVTALPADVRGIVTGLEASYERKARGRLAARCRCSLPELEDLSESVEHRASAEILDAADEPVAAVRATWLLSPR